MKKQEVHKSMQTDKIKYLIDIYFEEEKMRLFMGNCEKKQSYLREKIYSKQELISNCVKKISNEKNKILESFKQSINERHSQFDTFINSKETTFMDLINKTKDDANLIFKLLDSQKDKGQLKDLIGLQSEYSVTVLKEHQSKSIKMVIETEEQVKKIKELVIRNMSNVVTVFANLYVIRKDLNEISIVIGKYEEAIKTLEEDFDHFNNPSIFPEAYNSSLIEVRKRLIFNRKMMSIIERMNELLNKENESRKKFIDYYGKYLTNEYIPSLKFVNLKLTIDFFNNQETVELPNVLIEEDEEEFKRYNALLSKLDVRNIESPIENDNKSNKDSDSKLPDTSSNKNLINISNTELKIINNKDSGIDTLDGYIRLQKIKSHELEQKISFKDQEIKKLHKKIEEKDAKIESFTNDIDKFSNTIENLNTIFNKQNALKDQRLQEKIKENESLIKQISERQNRSSSCIMCYNQLTNNSEYESWPSFVQTLNEQLLKKNIQVSEMDVLYRELISEVNFIKKTFFTHLNNSLVSKNREQSNTKEDYELKLLNLENDFKISKQKFEEEAKIKNALIENSNNEMKKEIAKIRKDIDVKNHINTKLQQEINEIKDNNDHLLDINIKYNSLLEKNDIIEKMNTELKQKNNLITYDLDMKTNQLASVNQVVVSLKSQIESLKDTNGKYSEICENQEILLKEKNEDLEKKVFEYNELEERVEKFRFLKINEIQLIQNKNNELEREKLELKKKIEELENALNSFSNNNNTNNQNNTYQPKNNQSKKTPPFDSDITKISHDNFFFEYSSTKLGSTENHCLTNINLTNLTKLTDDEYVNIKKLEKGSRCIFVPYAEGIYVPICLSFNESEDEGKVFKSNYILNISKFDDNMKFLLM